MTTAERFQLAVNYHHRGDLAQAETLYRQILGDDPAHVDAFTNLGIVLQATGRGNEALACFQEALRLNPNSADGYNNLANTLKDQGRLDEAIRCYRQALRLDPEHANAHNNLGIALANQGLREEAIACFRQALRIHPQYANALNNLGNTLQDLGQTAEAIPCFRQALQINPSHANALNNLGNALVGEGHLNEAMACFQQALRIIPAHGEAHNNLGLAHVVQGQHAEAAQCFRQALNTDPNNAPWHINLGNALMILNQPAGAAESFRQALRLDPNQDNALNNLGHVLEKLGQTAEAVSCYRRALRVDPHNANALNNLGSALVAQGDLTGAAVCYRQALSLSPDYADARVNLGNVLTNLGNVRKDQGAFDEAAQCYRQALDIDPNHEMARWNRGLLRLLHGDCQGGWPDYEMRWSLPGKVKRSFSQPRWEGSTFQGKTVLVYSEQGFGDTIQFARYLTLVKQRVTTVFFECQPALFSLMKGVPGVDRLFVTGESLPPFDVHIPVASLPALFGTTLDNVPCTVPYLIVNPSPLTIKDAVAVGSPLNIGIVWQGSQSQRNDRRSVPLTSFGKLAQMERVRLFSLQVGPGSEQLAAATFPIIDLGSRFNPNSLEDLASAMAKLDLVITIDTAAAHLAGALGLPVWVLLQFVPDWRWLLERSDSPWYPTMRLFRERWINDWEDVFERIAAALPLFQPGSTNRG